LGTHDKCPISVSFIARHGGDRFLLDITQTMYTTIQEQVEILAKSSVSSKLAMNEEAAEAAKEKVSFSLCHILVGCNFSNSYAITALWLNSNKTMFT
jgi:hypothetical protein